MENKFIDGIRIYAPHEKAPQFVKGRLSIKRLDLINFLQSKTDEWINADIKESKKGNWYLQINEWKPKKQDELPQVDF
jgi:hypothetical protein